jgi:phosphate-selective porin
MKILKKNLILLLFITAIFNTNKLGAQQANNITIDSLARNVTYLNDELNKLKKLKISGYMQPQWQYIDSAGAPSVAGGDFLNGSTKYYSRFTIRRGRIKFVYDYKNTQFVLQPDITEKGVALRDAFVKITDPWSGAFSLTAGMFQDQFGFELTQSSSVREAPEQARFLQMLFPGEYDLGVLFSFAPGKKSFLNGLKLDAGIVNGSAGIAPEFDNYKDYTGRLSYSKISKNEHLLFAAGVSSYYGGYRTGSVKDYNFTTMDDGRKGFAYSADTANYNRVAKRAYLESDIQITLKWKVGTTTLRAEYVQGEHPGTDKSTKSIGSAPTTSIYHRQFSGAYFYFIQNIGHSKLEVVAKYDWYDPNLMISGKNIGEPGTNTKLADIRFDTYGFGINYKANANVKLIAYYDYVLNEATSIADYKKDIKDNVLTIRMQFKF